MKRVSIRLDVLFLLLGGIFLFSVFSSSRDVTDSAAAMIVRPPALVGPLLVPPISGEGAAGSAQPHEVNPALPHQIEHPTWNAVDALEQLRRLRSPNNQADRDEASEPLIESIDQTMESMLHKLHSDTGPEWQYTHEKYVFLKRYLTAKALHHRLNSLQDENKTSGMEFVRVDEKPSDAVYRVPTVSWNAKSVISVEWKRYGLYTTFEHIRPREPPNLNIAVEMSGHMRTYRKCYASTVQHLLQPNHALLFAVTYPDVGDKRFGVREQERDLPVVLDEVADLYGPYLAAVYILDVPTVTTALNGLFPAWFHLKQWSWMIYQLFTMDVAHDITTAHLLDSNESKRFHRDDPTMLRKILRASINRAKWTKFDVVIRVRPDLYILGPITILPYDDVHYVFNFSCGGNVYELPFDRTQIIRAPHHPNYEWYLDKLSDHSAVGFTETMGPFMKLFSGVKAMSFSQQGHEVFKHGNTAERMWGQHADRLKFKLVGASGWHIMLRNAEKYANSTHVISKSGRRKQFTQKVFGVTDPHEVTCPTGKLITLPPKKVMKKKVRS